MLITVNFASTCCFSSYRTAAAADTDAADTDAADADIDAAADTDAAAAAADAAADADATDAAALFTLNLLINATDARTCLAALIRCLFCFNMLLFFLSNCCCCCCCCCC